MSGNENEPPSADSGVEATACDPSDGANPTVHARKMPATIKTDDPRRYPFECFISSAP